MDAFTGEIRLLPYYYAPQNWLSCDGQQLQPMYYQALFSLIGNRFGGDGRNTFNLPNLNGRTVIGTGTNPAEPGLTYQWGVTGGVNAVQLTPNTIPPHSHALNGKQLAQGQRSSTPSGNMLTGIAFRPDSGTGAPTANPYVPTPQSAQATTLHPQTLAPYAGGNQPHENRQPFLALQWCICVDGEYPYFPD